MSTPNITINPGQTVSTFLESLPSIPLILDGTTSIPFPSSLAAYYSQMTFASSQLAGVPLTNVIRNIDQLPPFSLSFFSPAKLNQLNTFFSDYSLPSIPAPTNPTIAFTTLSDLTTNLETNFQIFGMTGTGNALYQGMLQDFATAMGIQLDSQNLVVGGDWSIITPSLDLSASNPNNPFILNVNKFLSTYTYPDINPPPNSSGEPFLTNFFNQYHQFLSGISTIQDPSQAYVDPTASFNPFTNLASYRQIFNAFSPDTSDAAFNAFFNQFYTQEIVQKGYFMPSQMVGDWFSSVQNSFGANTYIDYIGSSLAENDSQKAQVINRIILLLISLIQTMQNVGIAQANRLRYLTQFQNAYTALETQVPVFLQSTPGPIGGTSSNSSTVRNELNSSFNGIVLDNVRSLRTVQQNNAQQVQSAVNTTNDAVNQQMSMVTTFLQQMTTLLGTILR